MDVVIADLRLQRRIQKGVRAGSPDISAIAAFPIVPKTLYGAARLCHWQSHIIDQYQRLGWKLCLWRAV
jgi:hypothetical protein